MPQQGAASSVCSTAKFLCTLILFIALGHSGFSQEKARIDKAYLKSYVNNTAHSFIAPIRWKEKNWVQAGLFLAVGGGAYLVDQSIQKTVQSNTNHFLDQVSMYSLEPMGSGKYDLPAMGLLYLEGVLFKDERSKKTSLLCLESFLVSGLVVTFPKYLLQRHRPYQNEPTNSRIWDGPMNGYTHFNSFPSGHTTSIFSIATVVASEYKDKPIIPVLCYTLAALSGISRVYDNKHWTSDIVAGAAFGFAIGVLVHNSNPWPNIAKKKRKVDLL